MRKFDIVSIVVLFVLSLGSYVLIYKNQTKVVYVNTNELFSSFKMTNEIDKEVKDIEAIRKHYLDSITDILKKFESGIEKPDEKRFNYLKNDYLEKRMKYSDELSRIKQAGVEKIWKQINQFVADYGKEKDLDIILGANGQGSLMYAKDKINITKELIDYTNLKYSGAK